jgi:hypothetical protein
MSKEEFVYEKEIIKELKDKYGNDLNQAAKIRYCDLHGHKMIDHREYLLCSFCGFRKNKKKVR